MGNAPASPTPKKTWMVSIETAFQASAVMAVNALHQMTIADNPRRAPKRSPSHPPGIWNSAYASRNPNVIQPIMTSEICSSSRITGRATARIWRSMYVIM